MFSFIYKAVCFLFGQALVNLDDVNSLEDVENCIFYYNHSVLLLHNKQYATAFHIISKVFSLIEPMGETLLHVILISLPFFSTINHLSLFISDLLSEESLAQKVSMLLLELLLQTHQPEKALPQISYIEQQFVSTSPATVSKLSGEKDLKIQEKSEKDKTVCQTLFSHQFALIVQQL